MVDNLIESIKSMMKRSKTLNRMAKEFCGSAYDLLVIEWYLSGKITLDEAQKWEEFKINPTK